jgi:hypothetical protein
MAATNRVDAKYILKLHGNVPTRSYSGSVAPVASLEGLRGPRSCSQKLPMPLHRLLLLGTVASGAMHFNMVKRILRPQRLRTASRFLRMRVNQVPPYLQDLLRIAA